MSIPNLPCGNAEEYKLHERRINNKNFLVAQYNMYDTEQYQMVVLDTNQEIPKFYQEQDINQLYRELKLDPNNLECNKVYDRDQEWAAQQHSRTNVGESLIQKIARETQESLKLKKQAAAEKEALLNPTGQDSIKNRQSHPNTLNGLNSQSLLRPKAGLRPKLRQKGFTHFIHIPLADQLTQTYFTQIEPKIKEEDRDLLVSAQSLHATILMLRMTESPQLETEIAKWGQVLAHVKKTKASIKGVDIFPVKNNYTKVLYLNIKGLDEIVDAIVSTAIKMGLVGEHNLENITFDRGSQTYRLTSPHITVLKAKGEDLFDATSYLKALTKINLPKIQLSQIKMSIVGTFKDGKGYYDQHSLDM